MAYNPGQEISSLAFDKIIGGALDAVVKAQNNSSIATVNFIKEVGFHGKNGEIGNPVFVDFKYPKEVAPYQPATETQKAQPAIYRDMVLRVPILTMLPIPYIRVASADIEFNVKINSISTTEQMTDTSVKASITAKAEYRALMVKASVEISASVSHQKKNSSSEKIEKEYSLNIKVHAVQNEMPAGTARILDMLEESITSHSAA